MEEEVTRTRFRTTLSDYGPTILGIVIVILIIVVGWSFFQSRAKKATVPMSSSIAQISPSPIAIQTNEPTARLNLGSAEPATPKPSATPSGSTTTKGGVSELPKTGFPILPMAIASLGMVATGLYLRRK